MSEYDLRTAILKELEVSIQDVSPDFMLVPRQKGFSSDSEHRVVDLLFYHRNMRCMIPIYFKAGLIPS